MTDTRVDRPQRPASSGSPDWRDHAACRDTDPELFFPVGNAGPALHQLDRAKQVCAGCPVRTPCLEWALASGQEAGVWGGTSEDERCALRRMRQASTRPDIADSRRAPLPVQKRRDQETRRYSSLGGLMDDEFIRVNAIATRAACARMTAMRLRGLHDSVEHASCLPGKSAWDRRAAAHAEIFILLARMTDDPVLAPVLLSAADDVHHLVLVAGPAANGMILSSRQRLLAYMRAGDANGAALEMEKHLRGLHFMSRLVGDNPKTGMIKTRRAAAVARQMFAESAPEPGARADAGGMVSARPRPPEQAAGPPRVLSSSSPTVTRQ